MNFNPGSSPLDLENYKSKPENKIEMDDITRGISN